MTQPKKFLRKDTHKKSKVGMKWRKPTGHQNKKRLHVKGHAPIVKPGYGSEKRHTNKEGLQIVEVNTIEELKKLNSKTQTAHIKRLGAKKKLELIKEAKKLNITITNLNIKKYEESRKLKQEQKQKTSKERKEKKAEQIKAEKKAEIEKKLAEKKAKEKEEKNKDSAEEKKAKEKEEKDKILTKAK